MTENESVESAQPVIHIQNFDGPLDLLLQLIKSQDIELVDIPIVQITDQYMTALRQMQAHQLDVAGDYFVMAATLMKMKAKLLLPATEVSLTDEEDEPSLEEMQSDLVAQLMLYQRFKQAASWFKQQALSRQQFYNRPAMAIPPEIQMGKLAPGITVTQLRSALVGLSQQRQPDLPMRLINSEQYTVKTQIKKIRFRLSKIRATVTFGQLFDQKPNREEVVTTFLALLEMTKQHEIALDQPTRVMPISVKKAKIGDEK